MATITGTGGKDFIHQAGDGLVAPPGYADIATLTNDGDTITPGRGVDLVYCGGGNDLIVVSKATDIDGMPEILNGGAGFDVVALEFSGMVDLSHVIFENIDILDLRNPTGTSLHVILTPDQINTLPSIGADLSREDRLVISEPGSVTIHDTGSLHNNLGGLVGSSGNDQIDILLGPGVILTISGEGGNDSIKYVVGNGGGSGATGFALDGGAGNDKLTGDRGQFTITGDEGNDTLNGGRYADVLDGGADSDKLAGGKGQDSLTGGGGDDTFVWNKGIESKVDHPDVIVDFSHLEGDHLDLSKVDADTTLSGDQAFTLGGSAFTHHAGELIQFSDGAGHTVLQGDVNGDGAADFEILLTGALTLTAADFIL